MQDHGLKTAVIYGSARRERRGINAARFIVNQLGNRGHTVSLVDTEEYQLPMLDLMHKEYDDGKAPQAMQEVADILASADGYVIVSGEYNHSVPPALKNLLDHYQSEYLYKPSAIVTYSAGPFGGVRGLINLRGILAELGTPSIPSAFPVSVVQKSFDKNGEAIDEAYEKRVKRFLDEYEWYACALRNAREKETCDSEQPVQQGLCRGTG